ncbi:MAG: DUF2259 domain-containing protein [Pseudomonadota bacterium]
MTGFRAIAAVMMLAVLIVVARTASAGDAASLHLIGFSQDDRYFAFVQYGQTDGLGAGYADLFVIDNSDNSWAQGSPVRVLMDEATVHRMEQDGSLDDAATIALDQVLDDGADVLAQYGISGDRPGIILATRTLYDTAPADQLDFAVRPISPVRPSQDALQIGLSQSAYDGEVEACVFDYDEPMLYTLTLSTGDDQLALSDSDRIPASRGCPLGYRLHSVIVSPYGTGQTALVVLTAMTQPGFEGPDHRFLADGTMLNNLWAF